ncbi:MAG: Rv3654c family TadE-like protein [Acidimicrobiia bacterium]
MSERGSVSVIVLVIAVTVAVLGAALGAFGQVVAARTRAIAAADAAVLAAAPVTFRPFGSKGTPAAEAARFADANGATLIRCDCPVDRSWSERVVTVEVEVPIETFGFGAHRVRALGRAEFRPVELLTTDW